MILQSCGLTILRSYNFTVPPLFCLLMCGAMQASAQPKTRAEKVDSVVAVIPGLSGDEKLEALRTLTDLTFRLPVQKTYVNMYLQEARRQKNVAAESAALLKLTQLYYPRFDSDSIFIIGDETVRFARQHQLYDDMFFAQSELIRRYKAQGQLLTALRKAEEAYGEAKSLQETRFIVRMMSSIGDVLFNMEQYEAAIRHWLESVALAASFDQTPDELFKLETYDFIAIALSYLKRPQEIIGYTDSIQQELDRLQRHKPDLNLQQYHFFKEYHRAMAYAEMKQPGQALEAIRRAEAVYDPQWNERNPSFASQIDNLYAEYNRAAGNYDKALELLYRIQRFDEEAGRESAVVAWKKHIAQVQREKGDHRAASDLYSEVMQKQEELNYERYYAQLGELRTMYELDKAEMESERRLAALRQQRYIIAGLASACFLLALIVWLTVWSRRKMAEKNRGLYLQIKEQDHLAEELEQMKQRYETGDAASTADGVSLPQPPEIDVSRQWQLVARFRDYLLKNKVYVNPETTVDEIIPALSTNRTYLYEAVKTVTGKSPTDYMQAIRLDEAKKMLESRHDINIEVIAELCGFSSRSAFYRHFHERYRISPTEYRKLSKEKA